MSATGLKNVKAVHKRNPDGSRRTLYYHRPTGQRLPDDPDSDRFRSIVNQLNAEHERERLAPAPTIKSLIIAYQASPDWRELAASTRTIEGYNIKAIEETFGSMPLAAVEERGGRAMFLEWRDEMAETHPRAADAKLARLARIFSFGLDREMITLNPLASFKRVYASDRSSIIWLPAHVEAFRRTAGPQMDLALMLGLHTGQRQGDLRALRWSQYDGEAISLVQSKTERQVYVPCTAALREILDAQERRGDHVLLTVGGNAWKRENFASAWDRAFERSGIQDDLHFHDLRGTAVTMLAEAGASVPEIATITGHTLESVNKILERYLARTKEMARNAIAKLEKRFVA